MVLVSAKIYSSLNAKPINNGIVLIEHDKITAVGEQGKIKIPQNIQTISCTGRTVTITAKLFFKINILS